MTYSPIGEDLFSEKVIDHLEQEGLTINWRYGYRLANRYEVKRVCAGGFGIVWIAEDQMQNGKRYAAKAPRAYFRKFIDPEEGERRQRLARWRRSARWQKFEERQRREKLAKRRRLANMFAKERQELANMLVAIVPMLFTRDLVIGQCYIISVSSTRH